MPEENSEPTLKEITPVFRSHLNEGYWYNLAKRLIDESETSINTSAEKFEKLTLWFWGVYTTIVGLGAGGFTIFLGKSISLGTLIGLILPSVILLIAYWLTTSASSSAIVKFEHRSPDSIREAFMEGIQQKTFYFTLARIFSFLACLLIPLTIFLANRASNGNFEVLRIEKMESAKQLTISGFVSEKTEYELSFPSLSYLLTIKGKTDTGHFLEKILIPGEIQEIPIRLWWKESDSKGISIQKTIPLNSK